MEQYDVSARIEGKDESLVAQLAPYERPGLPWEAEEPVDQAQLALLIEMTQNPPGLMAWATVRNHRWSIGKHWRSGVFLRHEDGHEALLDFTSRRKSQLALTVRGAYPAHFMHLLQDGLEVLIRERWPYLAYDLFVPCPTRNNDAPCEGHFPLRTLHQARAKGIHDLRCQVCLEEADVGKLLEGYIVPVQPLSQQLIEMERRLKAEYQMGTQRILAEAAELTRRVLRAMMDEARDGPRLFTLSPVDPDRSWDPRNLAQEELLLTLWCEHPGHEHALGDEGQYRFRNPREWVYQIAPYALLATKVLRVAAPFAYGAATMLDSQFEDTFKFMEELSKSAAALTPEMDAAAKRIEHLDYPYRTRAEGAGLRAFHDLLEHVGWQPGAANLRRVTDKSTGDVLWVCPMHYKEYDPGLPVIPEQI